MKKLLYTGLGIVLGTFILTGCSNIAVNNTTTKIDETPAAYVEVVSDYGTTGFVLDENNLVEATINYDIDSYVTVDATRVDGLKLDDAIKIATGDFTYVEDSAVNMSYNLALDGEAEEYEVYGRKDHSFQNAYYDDVNALVDTYKIDFYNARIIVGLVALDETLNVKDLVTMTFDDLVALYNTTVSVATTELDNARQTILATKVQIEKLSQEIIELKTSLETATEEETVTINETIAAKEAKLADLEASISGLVGDFKNKVSYKGIDKYLERIKNTDQFAAYNDAYEALKVELTPKFEAINTLHTEIAALRNQITKETDTEVIAGLEAQIEAKKAEVNQLNQDIKTALNDLKATFDMSLNGFRGKEDKGPSASKRPEGKGNSAKGAR